MDLAQRSTPLTFAEAAHLLRRTIYHPSWSAISSLVGKTPLAAVDAMLNAQETPPTPPAWANNPPEFQDFAEAARLWPELQLWWMNRVLTLPSLRERMVMIWHNVFTSDYITVYAAQLNVKQSETIRTNAFNFRVLAEAMIGDAATLRYLNGDQSIKGNPNENFAREWFELFTLGVGNYTEADVVQASRAFTGWRIIGLRGVYNRQLADLGQKTVLDQTGPWEWADIVRITFEHPASARWVARKLCKAFLEHFPSEEDVDALAALLRTHNFNLAPVLRTLLTSEHFFRTDIRGALIKSPAELVTGLAAILGGTTMDRTYAVSSMTKLTQEPFYPPTVEGWKGHHAWISSSTFPQRQRYAESFVDGRQTGSSAKINDAAGTALNIDLVALVRQMPDADDAEKLVNNVSALLLPIEISKEQHAVLLEIMLAGAQVYEWDIDSLSTPQRLKFLFQALVRMPEFQLM